MRSDREVARRSGLGIMCHTLVPLLLLILPAVTNGQILNLDTLPPFPGLNESVLDEIAERMLTDLPPDSVETDADIVQTSMATLRRVIAELATRGRGRDPGDVAAALAAVRLADALPGLRRRFEGLAAAGTFTGTPPARLEESDRRRGLDRLGTFVSAGLAELRRRPTASLEEFDDVISLVLAPLVDAVEIMERRPLEDRWPSESQVEILDAPPSPSTLPPLPDRPELEAFDQTLREDARAATRRTHRLFREAASRADELPADGIAAGIQDRTLARLTEALETSDPWAWVEVFDLTTRVAADLELIRRSQVRRDADPNELAALVVETLEIEDLTLLRTLLRRQSSVISLIAIGSDIDFDAFDRTGRIAARGVERRYRRVVKSSVDTLMRIGRDPTALGDPAAVGALRSLQATIDDLERLRRADSLVERLTSIRPGAAREFETRLRTWCGLLANDASRMEGADAIDAIASDLDRFMPLPGEAWLADEGRLLTERTGGRGGDLLDQATETRRRWADEVSTGVLVGPARAELVQLARLGRLLVALNAVLASGDDQVARGLATSDRWGGWFVTQDRLAWTARNLAPSIRLACAAAADGDGDRLERDLVRLETAAPPALLVAWLAAKLDTVLSPLPSGSLGGLAAVALPPDEQAWGREHRIRFARICVAFAELDAALARDDEDTSKALVAWTVQACEDLLARVETDRSLSLIPSRH